MLRNYPPIQQHEDAQRLAEEHKEAAFKDKQAAELARSSAQNAQQVSPSCFTP